MPYPNITEGCVGALISIIPPKAQIDLAELSNAGLPPIITVTFGTIQGPGTLGIHGFGNGGNLHIPKLGMFIMVTLSIILPKGPEGPSTLLTGSIMIGKGTMPIMHKLIPPAEPPNAISISFLYVCVLPKIYFLSHNLTEALFLHFY
jgi:hypothetical protein